MSTENHASLLQAEVKPADIGTKSLNWDGSKHGEVETEEQIVDTDDENCENKHTVDAMLIKNSPKHKYKKRMTQRRLARNQGFANW
jgi:hypothetical protein